MKKPADFDKVQAFGEFTPIELGGHILEIKQVKEETTENGKIKIIISFDTHSTDKQANYFMEQYKKDTRTKKRWSGTKIEWPFKGNGETNPFFKKFIDSVAASNKNFKLEWDEKFEGCFKGMLVGGVFGREEYLHEGQFKMATKCVEFRSVAAIKAGVEIPKDKLASDFGYETNDLVLVNDSGDSPF